MLFKQLIIPLLVLMVFSLSAIAAFADTKGLLIQPKPPKSNPTVPDKDKIVGTDSNDLPRVMREDEDAIIPGGEDNSVDGKFSLFEEPVQSALVAWNGKEQMLFLTVNQKSLVGTRAMISIMPLPGEPIKIERSERKIITNARNLVEKKIIKHPNYKRDSGTNPVVYKTEIGVHKIFVWKIDDINTLENDLNYFIVQTYGKNYSLLMSKKDFEVLKKYHGNGFKYFAFDLTEINGKAEKTKETILYHYKSYFAFYPIAISQGGSSGISNIELTVISPSGFNKVGTSLGGMNEKTLREAMEGGVEVDLSLADLRSISPEIANLFKRNGRAKARIFQFKGNLDGNYSKENKLSGLNKDVIFWQE
jgi:hypothetical protein